MPAFDVIISLEDIFHSILSFLDKNSLSSSELSCRSWHEYIISKSFWKNLLEYEVPNYFTAELSTEKAKRKLIAWGSKEFKWKSIGMFVRI
jgi:hypothetical protein